MLETHFREVCQFGAQCRCPSTEKSTRAVLCPTPAIHDPKPLASVPTLIEEPHFGHAVTKPASANFYGPCRDPYSEKFRSAGEANPGLIKWGADNDITFDFNGPHARRIASHNPTPTIFHIRHKRFEHIWQGVRPGDFILVRGTAIRVFSRDEYYAQFLDWAEYAVMPGFYRTYSLDGGEDSRLPMTDTEVLIIAPEPPTPEPTIDLLADDGHLRHEP